MSVRRAGILTATIILATFLTAGGLAAHGRLLRAEPAPGTRVTVAPKVVRVWFTLTEGEELDVRRSTLSVWNSAGARVDDGKGGVDLNDLDRSSMIVRLKALKPGTYTVKWKVITDPDGAVAQGSFRFTLVGR